MVSPFNSGDRKRLSGRMSEGLENKRPSDGLVEMVMLVEVKLRASSDKSIL
jgi:hypothetical protein